MNNISNNQSGQMIVVLILTIVVALAIGLSISTRSLNEISTASKTEQSTRAYSAAEAGIEKGLQELQYNVTGTRSVTGLTNQTQSNVTTTQLLPTIPGQALEYGAEGIGKDEVAQIWLADPNNSLSAYYTQGSFDIYFGNTDNDTNEEESPAVEVIVVTLSGGSYSAKRFYYDSSSATGTSIGNDRKNNGFQRSCSLTPSPISTIISSSSPSSTPGLSSFFCKVTVSGYKAVDSDIPIMVRIRLLYSTAKQKVALQPTGTCGPAGRTFPCSLPPQARLITSVGTASNVERRLLLFKQDYVVPPLFDYVLFSAGDISK